MTELSSTAVETLGLSNLLFDEIGQMDVVAAQSYILKDNEDEARGILIGLFRAERTATRGSAFYRGIW